MENLPNAEWFEMRDVRRRRLSTSVWIPLRLTETIVHQGEHGKVGEIEEIHYAGSVAFHPQYRNVAETLGWMDIGISHSARPFAFDDGRYKPADVYMHDDTDHIGVDLVLEHRLNGDHQTRWLINQDLVLALGLLKEGDVWRRVDEGYIDVIRSRRGEDGRVVAIEIKAEFLRDYLAARGLSLRVAQYRQRMAIVADASYLPWAKESLHESGDHDRFEARAFPVDTTGAPYGGRVAVFKTWRTDVDNDEDVPVFGPENDNNTASESTSFERGGEKAYRAEGELWREEWIEAADRSVRVRGDRPAEDLSYCVDAAGNRVAASQLNNEDVGRYLWFRPTVIEALLQHRGSGLGWYTRQTGWVKCSPDYSTHFGVSRQGLVNVYAFDVAKLPQWQQRIWYGHNATPDGSVSSELLDSQQRATPARTFAPESMFDVLIREVNETFARKHRGMLFRRHESTSEILKRVHRFRAIEVHGLLALAKDIARLTADSIDVGLLRTVVAPPKGEHWRSLSHLEQVLGTHTDAATARNALTPLVGVYELRLGDAHLPSREFEDSYKLAGVSLTDPPIDQAVSLIGRSAESLLRILKIMRG